MIYKVKRKNIVLNNKRVIVTEKFEENGKV